MDFDEAVGSGEFARLAKSVAGGQESVPGMLMAAEAQRASGRVMNVLRAASSAGRLGDPIWADALASYSQISQTFIAAVRPRSIFYSLAALATPAPMRSGLSAIALIRADAVEEGDWFPVVEGSLPQRTLQPSTAGAIIVVTQELIESSDPTAFAVLRAALEAGAVAAVDRRAWAIATSGIAAGTASAAPLADLRSMLDIVNTTGAAAAQLLWVMAADAANAATTAVDLTGRPLFPQMTPAGGILLGLPVVASDAAPAGTITLLSGAGFAVNGGNVAIDGSTSTSLSMRDDPTGSATTLINTWQTNQSALRVRARFGLERLRDSAVAVIGDVPAGWAAS